MKNKRKESLQKFFTALILLLISLFIISNFKMIRGKQQIACAFATHLVTEASEFTHKPFTFVLIPSSSLKTSERHFTSILTQNYPNFRIIFVETAGFKQHAELLQELARRYEKTSQITIVTLEEELDLDTFKKLITSCKDNEIIVQIDGHDWLADDNVLQVLNQTYNKSADIWLTYSQYVEYPSQKQGIHQPYVKKLFHHRELKKSPWLSAHFKTYYAGLFKQIPEDSRFTYKRPHPNLDLYMLPMLHLAKHHVQYIELPLFFHNNEV